MKCRRRVSVWLLGAAALLAAVLPGCTRAVPQTSRVRAIPSDGIVRQAELAALKKSGDIAIYRGKNDGIAYEWTFVGPDIQTPSDVNLSVTFHPADEAAVRRQAGGDSFIYQTAAPAPLPGNPTLSITLGNGWEDGSYRLYTWSGGRAADAGSARVTAGVAALSPPAMGEAYLTKAAGSETSAAASAASAPSSAVSAPSSAGRAASAGSGGTASAGTPSASAISSTPSAAPSTPSAPSNSSARSDPNAIRVTLTIRCDTAVTNWNQLKPNVQDYRVVPANGVILPPTVQTMHTGDSVYGLLKSVCQAKGIQYDKSGSEASHTIYIKSINNLKEKDCGPLSGWMYKVNGALSEKGVSQQTLENGCDVEFLYTCNLGKDLQ